MTKLQNYFKDFLPLKYHDFQVARNQMTSNQSVVAELLRVCCEEDDVKAMKMAFERILGKPEKVIIIKRTATRIMYPDARRKALAPSEEEEIMPSLTEAITDDSVVVSAADAPGQLLSSMLDDIGERPSEYAYSVIDDKAQHSVAHVFAANVYAVAMRGGNLGAINLLFEYLDGAIADVIRIDGEQTIELENYADEAPYDAVQDENGVYYVEKVVVK